jgi:SAM-dependent methyltransferase
MNADEQKYREFWSPKSFKEAHDKILEADDWDSYTQRTISDIITDKVKSIQTYAPATTALEIGCGVGRLMKAMTKHFDYVFGVDISAEMVAMSKEYLAVMEDACLTSVCDGKTIPYRDNTFEFIYSVIVFQHIPYRDMIQNYIREIKRTLRDGGMCRIQTHKGFAPGRFANFHGHFYPDIHSFAQEFTDAGLKVIEQDEVDNCYLWITAQK